MHGRTTIKIMTLLTVIKTGNLWFCVLKTLRSLIRGRKNKAKCACDGYESSQMDRNLNLKSRKPLKESICWWVGHKKAVENKVGVHEHYVKAYGNIRFIYPLLLNLGSVWRYVALFSIRLPSLRVMTPQNQFNERLDGPRSWSKWFGEEVNLLTATGNRTSDFSDGQSLAWLLYRLNNSRHSLKNCVFHFH
jgi:hypothetical protein